MAETFVFEQVHCECCGESFTSEDAVYEHWWEKHTDMNDISYTVRCEACEAEFSSRDVYEEHKISHIPSSLPCACPKCDEQFPPDTEKQVKDHFWTTHLHETAMVEHHYNCPSCDHRASSKMSLLVNHYVEAHDIGQLFSESIEQSHVCPRCGDALANGRGMLQHVAHTHDLDLPVGYECTHCQATFETPDSVADHFETEHAPNVDGVVEAVYGCTDCDQSGSYSEVREHYQRVHLDGVVACPDCTRQIEGVTTRSVRRIQRHRWRAHNNDVEWSTDVETRVSRDKVLDCLYNINKHAKKYAELAEENYRSGKKTTAKANSIKKNALYAVKRDVLKRLIDDAEEIRIHTINGNEFYLFDFTDVSFHTPIEDLQVDPSRISGRKELSDFDPGAEKEHSDRSLKESLLLFEKELGINANERLSQQYLSYGHKSYFIGWEYLGELT